MNTTTPMLFTRQKIMKILLPLALQGLLTVAIGMIDSVMISSKGEAAFAGVSLVTTLDVVLIMLFTSLTAGGSVVLSQAVGRGDREHACEAAKQLIYAAATVAAVITVTVLSVREPLLRVLFGEVEADVMQSALAYFSIIALSFPLLAIENSVAASFRAHGDSVTTLKTSICMNLLNIAGNALFIYGMDMGSAGAALATLISRLCGASVLIWLAHNRERYIHIKQMLRYRPNFRIIREILRIGVPNGVENTMFQFGRLMTTSLVSTLGTASIAANAAALSLTTFQYTVGTALQNTTVTVVGQCIGAREIGQAKHYARRMLMTSYLMISIVAMILAIFAVPLLSLYGVTPEAADLARNLILFHTAVSIVLWSAAFVLPNSFRAANDVTFSMVFSTVSMWVFRVGVAYLLAQEVVSVFGLFTIPGPGLGLWGVWFAMSADWLFRCILFLIRFFSGRWLKKVNMR